MTAGTIQFITLLLGLVSGPHQVALRVDPGVDRVEVRLDGVLAGTLDAPPWTLEVDFGPGLVPRVLEAGAWRRRSRGSRVPPAKEPAPPCRREASE